jgi:hypothetical protein
MGKIKVCEICRSERCNGKIYIATTKYGPIRVCESRIEWHEGKRYFRNVIGHGVMEMLEVVPEK